MADLSELQPRINADEARSIDPGQSASDPLLHRALTQRIIGAALAVHRELGPGFLEKVYETAMLIELAESGIPALSQAEIPVSYHSRPVGFYYADILVDGKVICEIKAAQAIVSAHEAQLLHYLKATGLQVGFIFNFGTRSLEYRRLAKSK